MVLLFFARMKNALPASERTRSAINQKQICPPLAVTGHGMLGNSGSSTNNKIGRPPEMSVAVLCRRGLVKGKATAATAWPCSQTPVTLVRGPRGIGQGDQRMALIIPQEKMRSAVRIEVKQCPALSARIVKSNAIAEFGHEE
jgi:hypothetical protein